jgi:Tol biopolymer transport system component/tRNA A-37 threonylcarbamoyl transferase component Bud32
MTHTSQRLSVALADRYRLERELGAGGMATVYLAQDLRHDRRVAIKVLHPELSAVIGGERFLAEIKVTANLQHPHILPLFDSGAADGLLFYVMPLVEGESLRVKMTRERQLGVEEAVRLASQVASALDYAHRHGVVHRDIKPENVLLHDGTALVADFGIALAATKAGASRMTATGMSLGTPAYMSPEQAMGDREVDARSDIYSLATMLYEMLVGDPPYLGSTAQAIVAKVLTEKPVPVTVHRDTVPSHVAAAIQKALQKLPADRFASAADFAKALATPGWTSGDVLATQPMTAAMAAAPAGGVARWRRVALGLGALTLASLALAVWALRRPAPPRPVTRYSMGLPAGQAMRQGVVGTNVALSPDGRRMVYVGEDEGSNRLFLRERDRLEATALPGTTGAANPVFSPDGERIVFAAGLNVELKVMPVTGGPPTTLANPGVGTGGGATWSDDGWIYYDALPGYHRIRPEGGTPELVVPLDSASRETGLAWPDALPNGKGLLLRSRRSLVPADYDLIAYEFATRTRHVLTKGLIARYVEPGYLVFVRADGAVFAAPFDQDRFALTGPAVPVFDGVMTKPFGSVDLSISRGGSLAYVPGLATSGGGVVELVTVTREGAFLPLDPPVSFNPAAARAMSLSPDGRRLVLDILGSTGPDLWVKQLPSGPLSRLTFNPTGAVRPRWMPDGVHVLYLAAATDSSAQSVWRQRADGSSAAEEIWRVPGRAIVEASMSSDGSWLVYRVAGRDADRDTYAVRLGRDTVPVPLLTGPFSENGSTLSPDGRWLAYTSPESGRDEVYVRPFPNVADGRWQVSTAGGSAARWAHNGRELFYEATNNDLMMVPVASGTTFDPGAARRLLQAGSGIISSNQVPYYELTPDGQRFIMARLAAVAQTPGGGQLVVVDNWIDELRAKMKER